MRTVHHNGPISLFGSILIRNSRKTDLPTFILYLTDVLGIFGKTNGRCKTNLSNHIIGYFTVIFYTSGKTLVK